MTNRLLFDTDVLIDFLRGIPSAVHYLESRTNEPFLISVITVAELYSGVRNKNENTKLTTFLSAFEVISLDEVIAREGGLYRRKFGKSHGVGLADALIAATAASHKATLITLNQKHFPMLENIDVPYSK